MLCRQSSAAGASRPSAPPPAPLTEEEATAELTTAVAEFLQFHGYSHTLEAFSVERQERRERHPRTPLGPSEEANPASLLERFDAGRREEFLAMWQRMVPANLLDNDTDTAKLEFYLQIYFAIYPLLPAAARSSVARDRSKANEELAMRKRGFKVFLETRGAELARTGEFLPYYALPYVACPAEHPSFKELFQGGWTKELRAQLDIFMQSVPSSAPRPRLYAMLAVSRGAPLPTGQDGTGRPVSALLRGEDDLADHVGPSPSRTPPKSSRSPSVSPITGTPSPMPGGHSPGGVGGPVPSSISPLPPINSLSLSPGGVELARSAAAGMGASLGLSGSEVIRQSVMLGGGPEAPGQRSAFQQAILPPLDYETIKCTLASGSDEEVTRLQQALRWRVSKSPVGNDRLRVVMTFVERDVLGCVRLGPSGESLVASICDRCSGPASEELARLINSMASTAAGREYLLTPGAETVPTLVRLLTAIPKMDTLNAPMLLAHEGVGNLVADSLLQQHALGALQKLSLLRRAQTEMIKQSVIPTICSLLGEELSQLSEYTVEYSMALLMNLSLRSSGKRAFEQCDILSVLDSLIESSNPQVRTYVNGTLYSVLQRQAIRNAARERGLSEFLQMVASNSEEVFARQIRYIQVQLSSGAPDASGPDSGDEEEFEDIDEDGEEESDEVEDFEAETSMVEDGLRGEELLCENFLADSSVAQEEEAIMRDSMAVAAATANMAKHFQGGNLGSTLRSGAVAASLGGEVLQRPATPASFNSSLRSTLKGELGARASTAQPGAAKMRQSHQPGQVQQRLRAQQASVAQSSASPPGRPASRNAAASRNSERPTSSRSRAVSRGGPSGSTLANPPAQQRWGSNNAASSSRGSMGNLDSGTADRAEREAAELRTKIMERIRDDPAGLANVPSAEEYRQAFGTAREIPRTPSTRGSDGR